MSGKYPAILILLGLAFYIPITRSIILYVLPLGSGFDDLVFVAVLAIGIALYSYNRIKGLPPMTRSRWLFVGIIVFVLTVATIIYSMF